MGCQWRAICAWVWIKHDYMKSEFELKGQFNIGCQWWGVVSQRTVQIIWGVRISEGQIIRAKLYSGMQTHPIGRPIEFFPKLNLSWQICQIFLPNLPNSVKIKSLLNISKFKISCLNIQNILSSGLDTWC